MQCNLSSGQPTAQSIPRWLRGVLFSVVFVVLCNAALWVVETSKFDHYRSYLPQKMEVDKDVFVGSQMGGFVEGCGVAVFHLSATSLKEIATNPLGFLNSHTSPRNGKHPYGQWVETSTNVNQPSLFNHVANSEEVTGPNCVNVPTGLKRSILSATTSPGSYFSGLNRNTELLVIPDVGLAVFSHDR